MEHYQLLLLKKIQLPPAFSFTIAMGNGRHQVSKVKNLPKVLGEGYCQPLSGTPRARGGFSSAQTWPSMTIFWSIAIFLVNSFASASLMNNLTLQHLSVWISKDSTQTHEKTLPFFLFIFCI